MKDIEKQLETEKKLHAEFESRYGKERDKCHKMENRIHELRCQVRKLEESIQPLKDNINSLTAERSKWKRELKRAGIKTE